MIFDMPHMKWMVNTWNPPMLQYASQMTNRDYHAFSLFVDQCVFDEALVLPDGQNVTRAIREFISRDGEWPVGSALYPLWDVIRTTNPRWSDDDVYNEARLAYGNYVCAKGILRKEIFLRYKQPVARDRPETSTYMPDRRNIAVVLGGQPPPAPAALHAPNRLPLAPPDFTITWETLPPLPETAEDE